MTNPSIALVQMEVSGRKADDLQTAEAFVNKAAGLGADLVILPEMFCCPYETVQFPAYAEEAGGPVWTAMSRWAAANGVYLVGGSIPEREGEAVYNTSFVFDRRGRQIACHRKAHLFDIAIKGGQQFRESDTLTAGNCATIFDTEFGRFGLALCYDIRFPEFFRPMVLDGAKAIFVPAAFNLTTGPVHWELLFRARAVDNQVYTVGVAPARNPASSYLSYGHSLVCSPWAEVIADLGEGEALQVLELDLERVEAVREQLPLLLQRRSELY